MFDIGWTEVMVIGVVALVVIGPKDLPDMFRTMGRFTAKARSMAREFSRAMEAAANETGVKDVAKDIKSMTSARSMGLDAVKDAAAKFEKWDPMKPTPKAATPVAHPTLLADPAAAPPQSAPPGPALGPETQALADQAAARKAIASEAAAKMKAVGTAAAPVAAAVEPPVMMRAPRLRKPKADAPLPSPDPVGGSTPGSTQAAAAKSRAKKPSPKDSA